MRLHLSWIMSLNQLIKQMQNKGCIGNKIWVLLLNCLWRYRSSVIFTDRLSESGHEAFYSKCWQAWPIFSTSNKEYWDVEKLKYLLDVMDVSNDQTQLKWKFPKCLASPSLRDKCPNTKLFLVRILLYSVRIQENTDQK